MGACLFFWETWTWQNHEKLVRPFNLRGCFWEKNRFSIISKHSEIMLRFLFRGIILMIFFFLYMGFLTKSTQIRRCSFGNSLFLSISLKAKKNRCICKLDPFWWLGFCVLVGFHCRKRRLPEQLKIKQGLMFFLNHFPMVGDGHQPYCRD